MNRLFITFWMTCSLLSFSFAQTQKSNSQELKSLADHWNQYNFNLDWIQSFLHYEVCHASEKEFVACIKVLDDLLDFTENSGSLISIDSFELIKRQELGSDFAPYSFVSIDDYLLQTNQVYPKTTQEQLKFRDERTNYLKKHYQSIINSAMGTKISVIKLYTLTKYVISLVREKSPEREAEAFGKAVNRFMTLAMDPHMRVVPNSYEYQTTHSKNSVEVTGIGVYFGITPKRVVVVDIFNKSGADKVGLKKGDEIIQVGNKSLELGDTPKELMHASYGEENSLVQVKIKRDGKVLDFKIKRTKVAQKNVTFQEKKWNGKKYGYIKISTFNRHSVCKEVKKVLQNKIKLSVKKYEGVILDLRDNPGGFMNESLCVAGLFTGEINHALKFRTVGKDQKLFSHYEIQGEMQENKMGNIIQNKKYKGKLAVLINSGSASGSEIVAGVIKQERDNSVLVGRQTFGKGLVQISNPWPLEMLNIEQLNKHVMIYSTQLSYHFRKSEQTPQYEGIKPDIETYKTPFPAEEDKFALTERNRYEIQLDTYPGMNYVDLSREQKMDQIRDCVKINKDQENSPESLSQKVAFYDYQLGIAEQALVCME